MEWWTYGAMEMLTRGRPDQYSTALESPRLHAVIKALVAVEYKWYWSPGDKTPCNVLREDRANWATVGKS
jgi:hypothetical protein